MIRTWPDFSDSPKRNDYDAVVVGSGPNGLAAAVFLAQKGASVLVVEAKETPGGGTRTQELTLPGFRHDVCSAVHPMCVASPFFRTLPLAEHGLEWAHPDFPVAQPMANGRAAIHERSIEKTAARLGRDEAAYRRIFEPLVRNAPKLYESLLGPLQVAPKHPLVMAGFGIKALFPARRFAEWQFKTPEARALFAGHAAHSVQKLESPLTTAVGLMLAISAHSEGWLIARGGSDAIAKALVAYFQKLGGEVVCGSRVKSIDELPKAKAYLFDTSPRSLKQICGNRLPGRYRKSLERYRFGPGAFKVDWALSEPIPWINEEVRRAGTVHVGGTLDDVSRSEKAAYEGRHADEPFVLLSQPVICDPSRAPEGKHIAWGYCHVPNGSSEDMLSRIEAQIERYAPGFRECILENRVMPPSAMESYNANYVGGDIVGGVQDWRQLYTRPAVRWNPYSTPAKDIFICSASTPPGGGVHGMCGYHAGKAALDRM